MTRHTAEEANGSDEESSEMSETIETDESTGAAGGEPPVSEESENGPVDQPGDLQPASMTPQMVVPLRRIRRLHTTLGKKTPNTRRPTTRSDYLNFGGVPHADSIEIEGTRDFLRGARLRAWGSAAGPRRHQPTKAEGLLTRGP